MEGNTEKLNKDWLKFLNEDEVKFQLMCASLYMTAYELLIDVIVNKTKDFFLEGLEDGELKYSEKYQSIKALFPRDIVIASSLWLLSSNCINTDDLDKIKELKKYRNEIAHEMPKIISDTLHDVKTYYINDIKALYRKINLWWFVEFEATINPDLKNIDLDKLDYDEVLMFIMLPMNHMLNIVKDEVEKRELRKSKT